MTPSILQTLRRLRQALRSSRESELQQLRREVSMLRAGLYEQGNRVSVIAAELRAEVDALKRDSE